MSWQATAHVVANSEHKGSALLLLIMIANHAHADGTGAYPSLATLALETRMSERQVRRNLRTLEQSGEIFLSKEPSPLGTNLWTVVGVGEDKMSPGGHTGSVGGDITMTPKPSSPTVQVLPTGRAASFGADEVVAEYVTSRTGAGLTTSRALRGIIGRYAKILARETGWDRATTLESVRTFAATKRHPRFLHEWVATVFNQSGFEAHEKQQAEEWREGPMAPNVLAVILGKTA